MACSTAAGQIHSVHGFGSRSVALGKRLGVSKAVAWGGGAELRIRLADHLKLSVIAGYERYNIEQDSALEKWNWRFWVERYAGNVRDALVSDSSLSAVLTPVQYMEVLPVVATVSLEVAPVERLVIRQAIGGGVLFFTRSLYMHERWTKRFPTLDHVYDYSYRNFAPDKKGNPVIALGQVDLSYHLSDLFTVDASGRYFTVVSTGAGFGYEAFPFRDALTFTLGLSFLY